ncbi:hypothetical protein CYMTET_22135, partial [Cymbomonas tetramitiformis]
DPKVVYLDEPTAAMDPQARREMWNLLERSKAGRVILMTTHYMEEADLLGDHIAIMSHGKLRAAGTSLELKSAFGIGYHLTVSKAMELTSSVASSGADSLERRLAAEVKEWIPEAALESDTDDEATFLLPMQTLSRFAALFAHLECNQAALGISSFGVAITSLEDVFMKLANEAEEMQAGAEVGHPGAVEGAEGVPWESARQEHHSSDPPRPEAGGAAQEGEALLQAEPDASDEEADSAAAVCRAPRRHGGWWVQFGAIFLKRAQVAKRDYTFLASSVLIPLVSLGVCVLFRALTALTAERHIIAVDFSGGALPPPDPVGLTLRYATTSRGMANSTAQLGNFLAPLYNDGQMVEARLRIAANSMYVSNSSALDDLLMRAGYNLAGVLFEFERGDVAEALENTAAVRRVTRYGVTYNTSYFSSLPTVINQVDGAIRQQARGADPRTPGFSARYAPFPLAPGEDSGVDLGAWAASSFVSVYTTMGFASISAMVGLQIAKERELKLRHQLRMSGVVGSAYFAANCAFDLGLYLVTWLGAAAIIGMAGVVGLGGPALPATLLALLAFGAATVPWGYTWSFCFVDSNSANTWLMLSQSTGGLVMFVAHSVLELVEPLSSAGDMMIMGGTLVLPSFGLNVALARIIRASLECRLLGCTPRYLEISDEGAGGPVLLLAAAGGLYTSVALVLEELDGRPAGAVWGKLRHALQAPATHVATDEAALLSEDAEDEEV